MEEPKEVYWERRIYRRLGKHPQVPETPNLHPKGINRHRPINLVRVPRRRAQPPHCAPRPVRELHDAQPVQPVPLLGEEDLEGVAGEEEGRVLCYEGLACF